MISPIALHPMLEEKFPLHEMTGKIQDSREFAPLYQSVCCKYGVDFLNAADVAEASAEDCVHMGKESHKNLAIAIAEKVLTFFQEH